MPRDIPVGNGSLLVNFDQTYQLRDLYWPHVGQENHTIGHPSRFGVWVDGQFRWVEDAGWQRTLAYAHDTLVTQVTLHYPDLALRLICQDAVDFHENLYLRQSVIHNEADREREVRLFLDWAADHALPSGVMAEQVHPYTNAPLSVSPLTWSHATLVMTVLEYMARQAAMSEHS